MVSGLTFRSILNLSLWYKKVVQFCSLHVAVQFSQKDMLKRLSFSLFMGRFLTIYSISLVGIGLFRWSLFSCEFVFQGVYPFHVSWQICWPVIFFFFFLICYPFNICRICSDVTFLIPSFGDLCLLSLFLMGVAAGLSGLLISSQPLLLLIFLLFFSCFPFHWYLLWSLFSSSHFEFNLLFFFGLLIMSLLVRDLWGLV